MDDVSQENDEPMNSANGSPIQSPTSIRKMSHGSVNSEASNTGSPKSRRQRELTPTGNSL